MASGARLRAGALLTAAALLAGSCDDGEDSRADSYRERGNAVCREAERAAEKVPEPTSETGFARYFERLLAVNEPFQKRFERLEPPEDLRSTHREAVREGRLQIHTIRKLVRQLRKSDDDAATLDVGLPVLLQMIERGNRLSRELGLKDCVQRVPVPGAEPAPS
jgi:hypothetical protein